MRFTKQYYEGLFRSVMKHQDIEIEFEDENSFFLVMYADGKPIKIRLDIRLYPISIAEANPLGAARNDCNMEPFLPPPVGRIEFSLNPFKMLVSPF